MLTEHDQLLLHCIRKTIHAIEPTARVILYGSRARGDAQPDSDWDLLILLDGAVAHHHTAALRQRLYELELQADVVLSVIVLSKQEWESPLSHAMPFYSYVVREGIEL